MGAPFARMLLTHWKVCLVYLCCILCCVVCCVPCVALRVMRCVPCVVCHALRVVCYIALHIISYDDVLNCCILSSAACSCVAVSCLLPYLTLFAVELRGIIGYISRQRKKLCI